MPSPQGHATQWSWDSWWPMLSPPLSPCGAHFQACTTSSRGDRLLLLPYSLSASWWQDAPATHPSPPIENWRGKQRLVHRQFQLVLQETAEYAFTRVAERLVCGQVCPGSAALRGIKAVRFGLLQSLGRFYFNVCFELLEQLMDTA